MPTVPSPVRPLLPALAAALLVGCGGDGTARLEVRLTDAPLDGVAEVNVPVDHVKVRSTGTSEDDTGAEDGGWHTLEGEARVIDLLSLREGVAEVIGEGEIPAGDITELRLVLADELPATLVMDDGSEVPLDTPSGTSSGLKIKGDIPVVEDEDAVVTLDFDASLSVHQTGNGSYQLKPVLRVVDSAGDDGDDTAAP